ncbi:MAG: FliA/WhiG family RNA polymerase sigma factor [Ruminococcus sp.]|jgi:RNA polymerase sigma factor for flagellar operon FliA|nr:FliA/WhiG family RNA polymerase sigma factor [Ruminococcus sp.]
MRFNKDTSNFSEDDFKKLLSDYKKNGNINARNTLVMKYAYIPQTVAIQLRGLANGYAQIDDMVNNGILTLIDCLDRFDISKGITFEYYAFMRVRGSIIDLVRRQDWVPRRVRELEKKINETRSMLYNKLGSEPSDSDIAAELDIPVEKLHTAAQEIDRSVVFSFEELIQNVSQLGSSLEAEGLSPEKKIINEEISKTLTQAIDSLNEREKLVISLYYYDELSLTEISKVIDVSIQRVSQIHAKAVSKLKESLKSYING